MTYFSLRKHAPEPEPDDTEEELEENSGEAQGEQPGKSYGPLLTGLFGPGLWLAARFGTGTAWGVHGVAVWAIGYYRGGAAASIVAVWLLAVLLFIPRDALERLASRVENATDRAPVETGPEEAGEGGRDGIVALLYDLIGDAHGVHLRTVLTHLQEHGHWEGKEVADLRQHLEALGIPVQPKLKIGGTPTRGVSKADLDALSPAEETAPSPDPSPTV